jgi:hypothetical protein
MKKFVLWVLVACMLMSMSMVSVTAVAEGDVYYFEENGWPGRHWEYMSEYLIADYEAEGWERYTGVLWYDKDWNAADFVFVDVDKIDELYNQGYSFHVIYSWICPVEISGKTGEQSVYVGRWILSREEAKAYYTTYIKPEIPAELGDAEIVYMSQFYYEGKACEIDGTEGEAILEDVMFIRFLFDNYSFGNGSELFIRTGEFEDYNCSYVLKMIEDGDAFFYEMPSWK